MKKILGLLLLSSQLLLAQRNVALFHIITRSNAVAFEEAVDYAEIPFVLAGGMMIVQASVNGELGNFILDTGAPGIVLDAKASEFKKVVNGGSVNGRMMVGEVEVEEFQLGAIKKAKTHGNLLDIHHLEIACGMDIMGLVGYEVLKQYELIFDFPNSKLQAFKSTRKLRKQRSKPALSIPFTLCGHLPVIAAKVGGKRVFLGLDSGAEVNLLDKQFLEKISKNGSSNLKSELLTGLDNIPEEVIAADIDETILKGRKALPQMRYIFSDLSQLKKSFGVPIDGLLGVPFFKDKVISIDYARKKILIWD